MWSQLQFVPQQTILERNPINVARVLNPFIRSHTLLHIREHILEKSPMNVLSVGRPSLAGHLLEDIREQTLERNPISVTCVKAFHQK